MWLNFLNTQSNREQQWDIKMNLINYHSYSSEGELFKISYKKKYKIFIKLKRFINISLLIGMVSASSILQAQSDSKQLADEYDNAPIAGSRYTNKAPIWKWQNTYQINIEDTEGNTLYSETIGDLKQFTFQGKLIHGKSYKAKIRSSIDNGNTWGSWSDFSALITVDTIRPTVSLDTFSRTSSDAVKISFTAQDELSGLAKGQLQIATDESFTHILVDKSIATNLNTFETTGLPNKGILYARLKVIDNASNESDYTTPKSIEVASPTIIQPVNNTIIKQSSLEVSGLAEAASKVQLYLNDQLVDKAINADEQGQFTTNITLASEGNYSLTAKASNGFDESKLSSVIKFSYALPIPKAVFVTPAEGVELSAPTDIEISAMDELAIKQVAFYIDDQLVNTLTKAPYLIHWDVTDQQNGQHTLKVIVTNSSDKTATIERQVTVKVEQPAPPPTVYTGKVTEVTPALTYGLQPITIKGQAFYRADQTQVANAPLKLILMINGFERKINIATDEQGLFSYVFTPQEGDVGSYQIAVIHPDETIITAQASFVIDRIKFNLVGYNLTTVPNLTNDIMVTATASAKTTNLHWVLRAEDQPNGQLTQGITIENTGINIAAGNAATSVIKFTADDTAPTTGTIYLVALADNSAELIRGKLQINYQLGEAMPNLYTTPTQIQTGVQQQSSVTENLTIGNRGLATAQEVQLVLTDKQGNTPPSWIFIASDTELGDIAVGQTMPIQLIAQPDNKVTDGIYLFNIKVITNKQTVGTIPVSISVTQHGQGSVRFDVADIYTQTLDESGQPILGVKDAAIKLQNEAVLTEEYTLTTDKQGIAYLGQLPPGIYRYRASAVNHMDTSGRIVIRPNSTVNEHIFLEYQTINVEFGVSETTVKDIYDIDVNATFNTQVPAPVVVMQPLAINIAGMLPGEEKTGEITITNYGLVQADNLIFNKPTTDNRFKYEFFGDVPNVLPAKSSVVILYKVTALDKEQIKPSNKSFASMLKAMPLADDDDCSSYSVSYSETHQSECANGDTSKGGSNGKFYSLTGKNCGSSTIGGDGSWGNGGNGIGSGNNSIGGAISSPSAIPMIKGGCDPNSPCAGAGIGAGGK